MFQDNSKNIYLGGVALIVIIFCFVIPYKFSTNTTSDDNQDKSSIATDTILNKKPDTNIRLPPQDFFSSLNKNKSNKQVKNGSDKSAANDDNDDDDDSSPTDKDDDDDDDDQDDDKDKKTSTNKHFNVDLTYADAKQYENITFIFGYSTGHVGTTTFADSKTYCKKKKCPRKGEILFLHENHRVYYDGWEKMDYNAEFRWVTNDYWPWMLQKLKSRKRSIFFDNGHHSLYFADGLMRYIEHNKLEDKAIIIRIRRHRYEAAVSLTFNVKGNPQGAAPRDPAEYTKCSFHPYMRESDVILKVKHNIWNGFSPFQKGLWLVDETEERWLQLQKKYPKVKFVEVYFEAEKGLSNNTFEIAHARVAKVLGLKSKREISKVNPHASATKTVKQINEQKSRRLALKKADEAYMKKMNYKPDWSYLPETYNSYDDPAE